MQLGISNEQLGIEQLSVGAHIVRPSPCGKSCYGICRKAPERSRPFPTMLNLRPVLTPNSSLLPPN